MIFYIEDNEGLSVVLSRCNIFNDHLKGKAISSLKVHEKDILKGRDGDICINKIPACAKHDIHDAKILINNIRKRLNIDELEEEFIRK